MMLERNHRARGIYLLPNLLTTGGLFAGFYAIVAALKGIYDIAAIAIYIAMIMDFLDGRVARFTNTQTAFGVEYDSLTDMVAFGVAPALVVYSWALSHLGKLGWLIAFLFTAATALRLARFNTQASSADKRYFQGLSSTAAAGIIAGTVWVGVSYEIQNIGVNLIIGMITLMTAILMVSNIRYHSFKILDLKNKVPFAITLALVLIFVGVAIAPPQMLFLTFLAYGISGPVITLMHLRKARKLRKQH